MRLFEKNKILFTKIIAIMEEKIIRPTTKPEAIKGKLLKYQGTDYCEFLPQAQGEPQEDEEEGDTDTTL